RLSAELRFSGDPIHFRLDGFKSIRQLPFPFLLLWTLFLFLLLWGRALLGRRGRKGSSPLVVCFPNFPQLRPYPLDCAIDSWLDSALNLAVFVVVFELPGEVLKLVDMIVPSILLVEFRDLLS